MRDNHAMHILIPYAAPPGPQCQGAINTLQLPHLARLLQRLTPEVVLQGSAASMTPLFERIWARALGVDSTDGLVPWAALDAQKLGLTGLHGTSGWAWITPCHWTIQSNFVEMDDPLQLALTTTEAQALWLAMQPYFTEDGITLFAQPLHHAGTRWLAHGAVFDNLPTASLDRVAGHTVDPWMPRQAQAQALRRLQNEMQMLLYTHVVNDHRATFKLPAVNSFWVSGTGSLSAEAQGAAAPGTEISLRDALRAPALHDAPGAWVAAWEALDISALSLAADRLEAGQEPLITLCGENQAVTLSLQPLTLMQRLQRRVSPPQPQALLRTL
jgi:hypothetical protein